MTPCNTVHSMISALVDDELSPESRSQVEQHLSVCADCRHEYETLLLLDDRLRSELTVTSFEENVAAMRRVIGNAGSLQQDARSVDARSVGLNLTVAARRETNRFGWMIAIASAILLVVFVFRSRTPVTQDNEMTIQQSADVEIIATLVRATGDVQVMEPGSLDWGSVSESHPAPLRKGSRLRTNPSVLCELRTAEDGRIRLNQAGELILHDVADIELVQGQLWCLAAEDEGITIDLPLDHNVTPLLASLRCPSASEVQCTVDQQLASCDSISTGSSETELSIGSTVCTVNPGETVSLGVNQTVDRKPAENAINKVWQLPLLAVGGTADAELIAALSELLAPIGRSKIAHMNEKQIRMLGPSGAIPLLAFAVSESRPEQLSLRRTAVSLGAELADHRSRSLLSLLAMDSDPHLSGLARQTLERLDDPTP